MTFRPAFVIGLLCACSATPDATDDPLIADDPTEIADRVEPAVGRWTQAEPISELASATDEKFPSPTKGGLLIYFTRTEMIGSFTVNVPHVASRASTELEFGVPGRPVAWGASSIHDQEHADDDTEWFFWRGLGQLGFAARPTTGDPWSFPSDLGVDGFSPSLSGDALSLYFVDFSGAVAVMTRADRGAPWSAPALVPVAGDLAIAHLDISADELSMLLADPGGDEPGIYLATRESTDVGFDEPELIGALAGPYEAPRFRADELEIVCQLSLGGDYNLYRSRYVAD